MQSMICSLHWFHLEVEYMYTNYTFTHNFAFTAPTLPLDFFAVG